MKNIKEVRLLISVGVDVSKGKSTVCILKPYGEVIMSPNDYEHTLSDLKKLADEVSGSHIHLDVFNSLEEGSAELILEKRNVGQ